uniref:CW-type domain-containing protein n=1 Tax=Rhizophora mucronata TaxID=61149 RepID=A0A2P2JR91_RHIMU
MEENSEVEEGEACSYKNDDDNNMDPDIALSYIDEKIQNVLGHFQKDFEGGVSAENLGAKFGGYGSFLPSYERSPRTLSRPKSPWGSSTPRSPNNLALEGALQSSKVTSNAPLSVRLGTATFNANTLQSSGLASGDTSTKQDSDFSSTQCAKKSNLKDESSHKSGLDQRTLKFRLKVSSDKVLQKNAAMYSGLGLGNSSSSSLGNSPEGSGELLPVSHCTENESPTSILQVMTSLPFPGGVLVSPLHQSLLCLMRKETQSRGNKTASAFKICQAHSPLSVDQSFNTRGNKVLSEEDAKLLRNGERTVELKRESHVDFENDIIKKNVENDTLEDKGILFSDLKQSPSLNIGYITSRPAKAADRAFEVSNEDGMKGRFFSYDLAKEDSLESISGQESGKSEKNAQSSWGEKVLEYRAVRGSGKGKSNKTSAPSKAYPNAFQCREDISLGSMAPSKQKNGKLVTVNSHEEPNMAGGKGKLLLEGKKSQELESSKKSAAVSSNESLRVSVNAAFTDTMRATGGVSMGKGKVHKLKLQKDSEVKDNCRESLGKKTNLMSSSKIIAESPKGSSIDGLGMQLHASLDKEKERFSGKSNDKQSKSRSSVKDTALGPCVAESALVSEVVAPAVDPVVIEENWVCCDSCQRWRLLPFGTKPEQLPEKWLCTMLDWLPGMNRCEVSEEETTRALNDRYHLPVTAGQNTVQNYANGSASLVTSTHVQHIEQKFQSLHQSVHSQGKKKHGLNEITKAVSSQGLIQKPNSTKCHLQESVQRLSRNDISKPPSERSLINNLSNSHNLVAEKHLAKQKEGHAIIGKTKPFMVKNKREANQHICGSAKKSKTEEMCNSDKYENYNMELEHAGLKSKGGFLIKATGRKMKESKDYSFLDDVDCDAKERSLVPLKKQGGQTQFLSDGAFLDLRTSDQRSTVMKKCKLKEWHNNENLHAGCVDAKESSESENKRVKKLRASKSLAKESNTISGSDRLTKKNSAAQVHLSASKDQPIDVEEIRSTNKEVQTHKNRKRLSPQQVFDGVYSLRKDFGSRDVSMTTASSSSKVSSSHKIRATFDEMKSSPVESVSSSPLRTSCSGKFSLASVEIQGKNDVVNVGLPETRKLRCWNGDADGEINQTGIAKSEKVSGRSHTESLKFFPLNDEDEGADHKIGGKNKTSSNLVHGNSAILKHHLSSSLDKAKKDYQENGLFLLKSGKGFSLQSKDSDRSSTSDFGRGKTNVADPAGGQRDLCAFKGSRREPEMGLKSQEPVNERTGNGKHSIPDKCNAKPGKNEKDNTNSSDTVGQHSRGSQLGNLVKLEDYDDQVAQLGGLCSRNQSIGPQQNLIQHFKGESEENQIQKESMSGRNKLFLHLQGGGRQESFSHESVSGSQQGGVFDGLLPNASDNAIGLKALRQHGDADAKNRAGKSFGHHVSEANGARDLDAPSPGRMNLSSQTATNSLKEANRLKDYADYLKVSQQILNDCGLSFSDTFIVVQQGKKLFCI